MAIDATVRNFRSVADTGTAVMVAAMLVGFMLAEVARVLIERRVDLPDAAYGIVVVGAASAYGAYGGPQWENVAIGGAFASGKELADAANVQSRLVGMV